jgi:hypothetical protein
MKPGIAAAPAAALSLVVGADGRLVLEGKLEEAGPEGRVTSEPFAVAPMLQAEVSISDVLYIKSTFARETEAQR